MNPNLLELINTFADLNVVVIGEAMLDSYLEGFADRLCREAPVPVVTVNNRQDVPGGAANTAVNLVSLGGKVQFLSVVGHDAEWQLLQSALQQRGVLTTHVLVNPARRTLVKHRVMAAEQMLIRFDQGSTDQIDSKTEQLLIDRLQQVFPTSDAILVSDYGYGILTPRIIAVLTALQVASPRVLVVDSRDLTAYRSIGATAVKPNYTEVVQLLNLPKLTSSHGRAEQITAQQNQLLEITGAQIAAVTLDREGALFFQSGYLPYRTYAQPQPPSHVTGAGDTFISALTLAIAAQVDIPVAAELAAAAAYIAVAKVGTSSCSATELHEYVVGDEQWMKNLPELIL